MGSSEGPSICGNLDRTHFRAHDEFMFRTQARAEYPDKRCEAPRGLVGKERSQQGYWLFDGETCVLENLTESARAYPFVRGNNDSGWGARYASEIMWLPRWQVEQIQAVPMLFGGLVQRGLSAVLPFTWRFKARCSLPRPFGEWGRPRVLLCRTTEGTPEEHGESSETFCGRIRTFHLEPGGIPLATARRAHPYARDECGS